MMASYYSDDCVYDFPPLIESMRLNIEGGPMYRGGRSGRAAAAYYREKEVIIALKNKYGNRYGRRVQSYKPDTEAWRPERYQRCNDMLNRHKPEVIPGGLQNRKPLIHIHQDWWAQTSGRADQQEVFSRGNRIPEKYSPGTSKNEGLPVTSSRTSHTVDIAELVRPSQQGRGMMRGKRVVDICTIYCADEMEQLTVNCITNQDMRDPESSIHKDQGNIRNCGSDQSPSDLIKSYEKEQVTLNSITNQDTRDPETSIYKDQGNIRNCGSDQSPSDLIKSDEKEQLTLNSITNQDTRDPESSIYKDQGNIRNCGSDQLPSDLIKSDEKEQLPLNCIMNQDTRDPESSIHKDQGNIRNCGSDHPPSDLIKSDETEQLTMNRITNQDMRDPESSIHKDQGNIRNCGSDQSPSDLITSDETEQLTVNCITNQDTRDPESSIHKDQGNIRNCESDQSPSDLIKSVENLSIL